MVATVLPAVVGVLGGSGGVGASTFAAALAIVAGAVLVDLDASSGGVDVLLGVESVPGARWSGLHVAGGHLDPAALAAGLPRAGPCPVLAADVVPDPAAVGQVVGAAAALGPVVLDLPRGDGPQRAAGLACCDLVVVLTRADVTGLVAARAVAASLGCAAGVVVRRGPVPPGESAATVGVPLVGVLPAMGERAGHPLRPARAVRRVAAGVLAAVARGGPVPARLGRAP